jgi:hypothetical protein
MFNNRLKENSTVSYILSQLIPSEQIPRTQTILYSRFDHWLNYKKEKGGEKGDSIYTLCQLNSFWKHLAISLKHEA